MENQDEVVLVCRYEPHHEHRYPADWTFGGPTGMDPRADPRWKSSVYEYYDEGLHLLHTTSSPVCEDQALDEFTLVATWGEGFDPAFLSMQRPGEARATMLPWRYDKRTDTVMPL